MRFSTLSLSTSALFALCTACADDTMPHTTGDAQSAFGQAGDAGPALRDDDAKGQADAGVSVPDTTSPSVPATLAAALRVDARALLDGVSAAPGSVVGLAFAHDGAGMSFLDGAFTGALPGDFQLTVSAAPAQAARWSSTRAQLLAGTDEVAHARLAILPVDHPAAIVIADDTSSLDKSELAACAADPACEYVERWCVTDATPRCRTVGLGACDGDCAPLHSEGDPAIQLNDDTPSVYSALSDNALVLWSKEGIARSSLLAHFVGLTEDVPAGYALIALGAPRDDERAAPLADDECAGDECAELYESEGLARYNAQHGTTYADSDALEATLPEDDARAARFEVQVRALEAAVAHGVNIAAYDSAQVIAAGAQVDVQFVADVREVL